MAIIHEFKSIKRILDRKAQKAEFDAKQPAAFHPASKGETYGEEAPEKAHEAEARL